MLDFICFIIISGSAPDLSLYVFGYGGEGEHGLCDKNYMSISLHHRTVIITIEVRVHIFSTFCFLVRFSILSKDAAQKSGLVPAVLSLLVWKQMLRSKKNCEFLLSNKFYSKISWLVVIVNFYMVNSNFKIISKIVTTCSVELNPA
jgi:hypothetical protein